MIKYFFYLLLIFFCSTAAYAKEQRIKVKTGLIVVPDSSILKAKDFGKRAHTNYMTFYPTIKPKTIASGQPGGETPASLACIYGLTQPVPGCPINATSALPVSGWGTIAIVDAYDYPTAEADLNTFSSEFGLPACTTANGCFQVVYASGTQPAYDAGWAGESSLDIEWAHAMAPNAKIILVEGATNSNADLFQAEDVASNLVKNAGGGIVSNSWGEAEFPGETSYDSHFQQTGIVYFVSTGDSAAPTSFPAGSPYVVAAGGTSIVRQNGNFSLEAAWSLNPANGSGGGGGPSFYEPRPSYQDGVQKIVGTQRGTPDFSFDADPATGVAVYSTTSGWTVVGGTSVSAPALAGIINSANSRASSSTEELLLVYKCAQKNYHSHWHDIILGNNGYPALQGYDLVTGLGSVLGYRGK